LLTSAVFCRVGQAGGALHPTDSGGDGGSFRTTEKQPQASWTLVQGGGLFAQDGAFNFYFKIPFWTLEDEVKFVTANCLPLPR